jgi:hypothetical protein
MKKLIYIMLLSAIVALCVSPAHAQKKWKPTKKTGTSTGGSNTGGSGTGSGTNTGGGTTTTTGSGTTYVAGNGINITGIGSQRTISNTGDVSNTNELQNLQLIGNQLSISDGNMVNLPVAPVGVQLDDICNPSGSLEQYMYIDDYRSPVCNGGSRHGCEICPKLVGEYNEITSSFINSPRNLYLKAGDTHNFIVNTPQNVYMRIRNDQRAGRKQVGFQFNRPSPLSFGLMTLENIESTIDNYNGGVIQVQDGPQSALNVNLSRAQVMSFQDLYTLNLQQDSLFGSGTGLSIKDVKNILITESTISPSVIEINSICETFTCDSLNTASKGQTLTAFDIHLETDYLLLTSFNAADALNSNGKGFLSIVNNNNNQFKTGKIDIYQKAAYQGNQRAIRNKSILFAQNSNITGLDFRLKLSDRDACDNNFLSLSDCVFNNSTIVIDVDENGLSTPRNRDSNSPGSIYIKDCVFNNSKIVLRGNFKNGAPNITIEGNITPNAIVLENSYFNTVNGTMNIYAQNPTTIVCHGCSISGDRAAISNVNFTGDSPLFDR